MLNQGGHTPRSPPAVSIHPALPRVPIVPKIPSSAAGGTHLMTRWCRNLVAGLGVAAVLAGCAHRQTCDAPPPPGGLTADALPPAARGDLELAFNGVPPAF